MIFPIIQFISRNVKCWDAKTSQSENVLYPLTKRIQGVLRFRVLPVPKQPVGGDQTHSCSGGTARWGHRALRKGSSLSVGAAALGGPNPRPSSPVPPAGHCEERSDVAIRNPRPYTFAKTKTPPAENGFPHQSADWFGMTRGGRGRRIPTTVCALSRNDPAGEA
jgi:hypothetical protein